MNKEYLKLFTVKTEFPSEAVTELCKTAETLAEKGQNDAVLGAVEFFFDNDFDIKLTEPLIEEIAKEAELSPYTVWLLMLIEASQRTLESYREDGTDEQIFWDTFADLRYKAIECKENYNVWGTFVAFWYPIFYSREIVKLGRLEFQDSKYGFSEEYTKNGYTVKAGDKVKSIHIPSSGEPFDEAARMDSYKRAYEYFKAELDGKPIVFACHSWLLYPEYGKILKQGSNIASFQKDFDIVEFESGEFEDAWRLYGADHDKPTAELPERTSMQRAFKKHLLAGGTTGEGKGVIIFDGEKILNK